MKRIFLYSLFIILSTQITSQANSLNIKQNLDFWHKVSAILDEHDNTIENFSNLNFENQTHRALSAMVAYTIRALNYYGFDEDAKKIKKEWENQFQFYSLNTFNNDNDFLVLDLGDHRPLSQWLSDLYKKLRLRFGDILVKQLRLDDINTLNYAIPVTFQPNGDKKTQDTWDKLEYSKHFVPFTAIVTYWASYGTCFYVFNSKPQIRKQCRNISNLLRMGATNWVAPKLSDWVYDKAHEKASKNFNYEKYQLRSRYEAEIKSLGF